MKRQETHSFTRTDTVLKPTSKPQQQPLPPAPAPPSSTDDKISITLHHTPCHDALCSTHHPHIKAHSAAIHLPSSSTPIGHITLYLFHTIPMRHLSPNRMWEESQSFDTHHAGAKLDKIENFLANESFSPLGQEHIDTAEVVVFIDQVWLEPKFRGRGRGLDAVRETVRMLQVPNKGIVMLQAGDVRGGMGGSAHDAGEKLTAHWRKLGFEAWSESDESWLLVWLEDVYWV